MSEADPQAEVPSDALRLRQGPFLNAARERAQEATLLPPETQAIEVTAQGSGFRPDALRERVAGLLRDDYATRFESGPLQEFFPLADRILSLLPAEGPRSLSEAEQKEIATGHLADLLAGSPKARAKLFESEARRRGWKPEQDQVLRNPEQLVHEGTAGPHWDFCARTLNASAPCNCVPPYAQTLLSRYQDQFPDPRKMVAEGTGEVRP